jgi:hypothetical protein
MYVHFFFFFFSSGIDIPFAAYYEETKSVGGQSLTKAPQEVYEVKV